MTTPTDNPSAPPERSLVEPMPARMLNEFVYCPRLFYYEHVEGVFVHNADTRRGTALHKRVDSGKGDLPAAVAKKSKADTAKTGADATPEPKPQAPNQTSRLSSPRRFTPAPSPSPPTGSA